MAREKTLVLVFPPLTMPTSAPLGSSMLKGFIERELPDWRVKVLDLNLWTFELLFSALSNRELSLNPEKFPEGRQAYRALTLAENMFRGKLDSVFYSRPDLYDACGDMFLRLTETYTQQLMSMCHASDLGNEIPVFLQQFLDLILAEKPDCIGFSMIFSQQLPVGATLGRLLRQQTGLPVIFGGSCFTDSAEHFLKFYPHSADLVISGDGEDALKTFLTDMTAPEKVPGAIFLKGGAVHKIPATFRKDIDSFGVPDFSDFDLRRYFSPEPIVPVLLSRGCYWRRCTFCVHYRSQGLSYRMHSMEHTIGMLKKFTEQGIRNFAFIDEMIAPKHYEWLAQGIKDAKLDISYYALSKPTKHFTPALLKTIAESGCKYMLWGLESGNQRILDLMDKGTKVADVSQLLKDSHAAGIVNHVFMICGFPTETVSDFADTIRFLDEHKDFIYGAHRGTFSLERESPIFDNLEKFGITRAWLLREDASGGRWGYECPSGMSMERTKEIFNSVLPFLRVFNPHARLLANFRDHALLIYDKLGKSLKPEDRQFPEINYQGARPPADIGQEAYQ